MAHLAKGTFEVKLEPLPFEGADPAWKLGRMSIDKQISGDLVATTRGQMLSAMTDTRGSAGYVAIESGSRAPCRAARGRSCCSTTAS